MSDRPFGSELTLAQLCERVSRDHDALMAEHREAQSCRVVRKVQLSPPPEPPPAPPHATPWRDDPLWQDAVALFVVEYSAKWRQRIRDEREKALEPLRAEINELRQSRDDLRGRVDTLTAILAGRDPSGEKSSEVVDLPRIAWSK